MVKEGIQGSESRAERLFRSKKVRISSNSHTEIDTKIIFVL